MNIIINKRYIKLFALFFRVLDNPRSLFNLFLQPLHQARNPLFGVIGRLFING